MSEFKKEIEIKFVVDEDTLNKISSIALTPYEETDEYFTTKEMLTNHTFLRIRHKKGEIVLQLKDVTADSEQTGDVYEADELHIPLDDEKYKKLKTIFERTFPHNFIVKKVRNKGYMNDCEICLDKVDRLGLFLEIEGPREKILEICKQFDLDMNKQDKEEGYAIMTAKREGLI